MSPVLFALALDPFLDYLSKQLPVDHMIRAYADDMALVLHSIQHINIVSDAFVLLGSASSLHVNVAKTVCVPLYPTTILQCRRDIGYTPWAGMEINMGFGKYLGFLVGPGATAKLNFASSMDKFRSRAASWLEIRRAGQFFQILGFNMFVTSVFNFISQLYVLPDDWVVECRALTLKMMLGPKAWIHGAEGHAFFRAHGDVGFPVAIRCTEAANLQLCFAAIPKHVPDFMTKLCTLEHCVGENIALGTFGTIPTVIKNSPYACCRIVYQKAVNLKIPEHLAALQPSEIASINKTTYNMFFDSIYKKRAAVVRLEEVYRKRWCAYAILNIPQPRKLAENAAKQLRWISKRLPPRVHLACVRFQFNGWHTGRRYQRRDSRCMFCKTGEAEDRIEHFIYCNAIQDLFPSSMKMHHANRVPPSHFFLQGLDGRHRLTFALILYAVYTVHNEFRHSDNHTDFKRCVMTSLLDVSVNKQIRKAVTDILEL